MTRLNDDLPSTARPGPGFNPQPRTDRESDSLFTGHDKKFPTTMSRAISPPPLGRPNPNTIGTGKEKPKMSSMDWTVPKMVDRLNACRQDMVRTYGKLARHAIESTKATDRRVHTGKDLFADLSLNSSSKQKNETLRIRIKASEKVS